MALNGIHWILEHLGISLCQPDHPFDQINPMHKLGDPMLHLQPGINFKKEEGIQFLIIKKFNRAGGKVADTHGKIPGRFFQGGKRFRTYPDGRSFFQNFLIPALGRAVTHPKGQCLSIAIPEDLDFKVTGLGKKFLQKNSCISKIGLRQATDPFEVTLKFFWSCTQSHTNSASPRSALEHYRITDRLGLQFGIC